MSRPRFASRLSVLLIASALALPGAPVAAQSNKEKAARFYEDALMRFEKKDIPGTIIQLKNALQVDKALLPVQLLLSRALLLDGQAAAAEVAVNEALKLGVDRAELAVILAQALLAQGKQQVLLEHPALAAAGLPLGTQYQLLLLRAAAMADLGNSAGAQGTIAEARALDDKSPDSWIAEVPVRLRARQLAQAISAADMAIKLAPGSAEAHYQRATIAHVQADLKQALAGYARALALEPLHLEARIAHAGLLLDSNKNAEAKADLDEARKRYPKDPRVAYLMAVLLERQGNLAAAKASLADVVALLDPVPVEFIRHRPQLLLLNGLAHHGLDEPNKAKPYLELFHRAQPATPVAKLLAQIYLLEDSTDKAIEVLESYLRQAPGDGGAMVQLANIQMRKGRSARAAQLMRDALKTTDAPQFHSTLGMALNLGGDAQGARKALTTAIAKDPYQLQAGMALVSMNLQEGRAAEAVDLAAKLLKQFPNNASLWNLAGVAKAQARDFGGARRAFESALALDKTALQPQLGLARVDIATQAFDAAHRRLRDLLKQHERNAEVVYDMAVLQDRMGQLTEAQRWLERAVEVSPKSDTQADFALIDFHFRHRRPTEALAVSKALAAKAPEDVRALIAYGKALLATGNQPAAQQAFVNAGRRAGFDAKALTEIAGLQLSAGDIEGAAYSLDKVLRDAPAQLQANLLMARVELQRNQAAQAEARAKRILQQHAKSAPAHQLLGDVAIVRGQPAAAVEAYRQAHRLQPGGATALPLFNLLSSVGSNAEARAFAAQWLKTNPQDLSFRKSLADHLARLADFTDARREYEAIIKLAPSDAEALNNLANVLLRLKDFKAAVATAEAAVKHSSNHPLMLDTLGWALYLDNQLDAALLRLRDARLRAPAVPEIRYHLAAALAKRGRPTEAREELVAALQSKQVFEERNAADALLRTLK